MRPAYDLRRGGAGGARGTVSTFDRPAVYLAARPEPRLTLTFAEVEAILGELLPLGARLGPHWWGDHPMGRRHHGHALRAAGWRVERLDAYAGSVTFVRQSAE